MKNLFTFFSLISFLAASAFDSIILLYNNRTSKTASFDIFNNSSISANTRGLAIQSINHQDLAGCIAYDDVTYP